MWSAKPSMLATPDLATELKRANDRAAEERWMRQREELREQAKRDAQSAREGEQIQEQRT